MRLRWGTVVAMLIAVAAPAQAAAPDASIAELTAFADRFDKAQVEKDGTALEAMVSDDLVFIHSSGKRQSKAEFIAGWTEAGVSFEPITITDRTIVPLGPDAGIVGGDVVLRGTSDGMPFAAHIRFADTFRRVGGDWRAVHIQVTRVAPPR